MIDRAVNKTTCITINKISIIGKDKLIKRPIKIKDIKRKILYFEDNILEEIYQKTGTLISNIIKILILYNVYGGNEDIDSETSNREV